MTTGVLDIESAMRELGQKPIAQIQRETAMLWTSRAFAAYVLYRRTGELRWLLDAEEYHHEALEHAALTGDPLLIEDLLTRLITAKRQVMP
jgi:hypothetical protein